MLPSELIDIDLDQVVPDDQALGLLEQSHTELMGSIEAEEYGDTGILVPRSDWKDVARDMGPLLRPCIRTVFNQGREGSCVGNGWVGALQFASCFAFGANNFRLLSPMSIYRRIGRSSQSGAYIPDAVKEGTEFGVLPMDTAENKDAFPHTHPATGFSRRLPSGWKDTARHFRVTKVLKVRGMDQFYSAVARGVPVVYGRKRHAIYAALPIEDNGKFYIGYVNSWGQWGDPTTDGMKGLGYDSEALINQCVGYGIAEVTVRDEIHVPTNPNRP